MNIPDSVLTPARVQAVRNRGKMVLYREFVSQSTNLKTGATTPTFRNREVKALIGGLTREEDGACRTFRFIVAHLPEYPPSERSVIEYGDKTYRIIGWKTSQHEDVVDVEGANP